MRFGVDFGTTHTVVALVDRGNYPIVSFEHGDVIPSVIAAGADGSLRFGHAALASQNEPGWQGLRSFMGLRDTRGGTFDASLIKMEGRSNEVITSNGVSRLGGDDFDEAILQLVLERTGLSAAPAGLIDEVRAQKETLNPNTRKFVIDTLSLPVDEV